MTDGMAPIKPVYTADNCREAFQLNWSLSVFWARTPPCPESWLDQLQDVTERDGVRILEHRLSDSATSQFLVSTRPENAPPTIAQSIKGRLQYLVRDTVPKPFRRNYGLRSIGSARAEVVEEYVRGQPGHHRMADARVQERLAGLRIEGAGTDLRAPRVSGHAQFCYNLHLVLVNAQRGCDVRAETLIRRRDRIVSAAAKKGHLLGDGSLLADHLHFTLGCPLTESPREIALSYLNNLAYVEGMKHVFEFGFYVGTYGEYDLGAVRLRLG